MLFRAVLIGTAPLAAATAVAGIGFAAPAHADEDDYLDDLHNAGITDADGDEALLQVGWGLCRQLSNGASPEQLRAQVLYNSDTGQGAKGVDPARANDVVNYAMVDLCPGA
jgi:hypothetical protein